MRVFAGIEKIWQVLAFAELVRKWPLLNGFSTNNLDLNGSSLSQYLGKIEVEAPLFRVILSCSQYLSCTNN
jgi:hypothetical protein